MYFIYRSNPFFRYSARKTATDTRNSAARTRMPFRSAAGRALSIFAMALKMIPVNRKPAIYSSIALNPLSMGIIIRIRSAGVVIVLAETCVFAKIPKIMPMTALMAEHATVIAR